MAIAAVFYTLLVVFLARYLRGADWSQLAGLELAFWYLLASVPFSLGSRLLQPVAWSVLIRGYGDRPPGYAKITRVYATSWLGRYIPGKVAGIGAKIFFGRDHGVRASTLAATSIAEAVLQLTTALALAFLLIGLWGDTLVLADHLRLLAMAAMLAMALLLAPPVFNRVIAWAGSLVKRTPGPAAGRVSVRVLAASATLYMLIHAMSGPSIYFVLRAMYPEITAILIPELTAAVLIAGTLGTLAVIAPAGLGVREGILIVLLASFMPRPVAVAGALLLRFWSIAMDLLYLVVAVALDRARPVTSTVSGTT